MRANSKSPIVIFMPISVKFFFIRVIKAKYSNSFDQASFRDVIISFPNIFV